jgi:hypothetical protein
MRGALRRCIAAVVSTALVWAPAGALAQATQPGRPAASSPQRDVAQAGEHFARGVKMYQEDDFRGALIEFNRANELAPNWAVLYNIGQTQYQLRDYAAALLTLERYVKEGDARIPADRRAQVDREIGELRGRVAHVTLASNVDAVEVSLDDAPLGKTNAREPVLVGAGRHRFTASKPGFLPASKTVDIAGGDAVTVRLELVPEAPPAPPPVRESPSYAGAAIAAGIGVAGIAVGTVFGVLTLNGKSTLDVECGQSKVCPSSAQADVDAYARNGTISGVGFGVGAVGVLLGGYLFFHERAKETSAAAQQARVTPWIGPTGAGLSGAF